MKEKTTFSFTTLLLEMTCLNMREFTQFSKIAFRFIPIFAWTILEPLFLSEKFAWRTRHPVTAFISVRGIWKITGWSVFQTTHVNILASFWWVIFFNVTVQCSYTLCFELAMITGIDMFLMLLFCMILKFTLWVEAIIANWTSMFCFLVNACLVLIHVHFIISSEIAEITNKYWVSCYCVV